MDNTDIIQYVPFKTFVHPSFWHTLSEMKLNVDKLSDSTRQIFGKFSYRSDIGPVFEVDGTSFNNSPPSDAYYHTVTGTLMNKNTIAEFKKLDKTLLLNSIGEILGANIKNKTWITNPNSLLNFIVLSYADLKKFNYFFWFAFPTPSEPVATLSHIPLSEKFKDKHLEEIRAQFQRLDKKQKSFFTILLCEDKVMIKPLKDVLNKNSSGQNNFKYDFEYTFFTFLDPSDGTNPGWPLRIFVAALVSHCPCFVGLPLKFFGLRVRADGNVSDSRVFNVCVPLDSKFKGGWVGWERNDSGVFGPRMANMAASMDPVKLAETSADLNIKLMKWRLLPDINLQLMKDSKCLLLGAGTLGCQVARNLIAWGFKNITFYDNGKVSYSNPTRQVLFNHQDCQYGGKKKAEAAAENLRLIHPGVNAKAIIAHIPMPGHPVGKSLLEETKENIAVLTDAIESHDIIFLLLDTREARWMPTLIATKLEKIVINAALGFDSYLVMRHGIHKSRSKKIKGLDEKYVPGTKLGCYFCNDVTAPGNSMKDRTLDQQCTVTRPGAAGIAGALAVEILVSLLQHPLQANAPAAIAKINDEVDQPASTQSMLGQVPHSIRGFLNTFQTLSPTCLKFEHCIACSDLVIDKYRDEGVDFILSVLNNTKYLEEVTGLKDLQLKAESIKIAFPNDGE